MPRTTKPANRPRVDAWLGGYNGLVAHIEVAREKAFEAAKTDDKHTYNQANREYLDKLAELEAHKDHLARCMRADRGKPATIKKKKAAPVEEVK